MSLKLSKVEAIDMNSRNKDGESAVFGNNLWILFCSFDKKTENMATVLCEY